MRPSYTLGVDLGLIQDHSAATVLERVPADGGPAHRVRHIHRWPLNTDYHDVVRDVAAMVARPPLRGDVRVAVDRTGVGVPVSSMLDRASLGCPVHPVMITAGALAHRERGVAFVPKADLIAGAQVALQQGMLEIAPGLPEAATLVRELLEYRYELHPGGRVTFDIAASWRQGAHDDVLLSLCVGLWVSQNVKEGWARSA